MASLRDIDLLNDKQLIVTISDLLLKDQWEDLSDEHLVKLLSFHVHESSESNLYLSHVSGKAVVAAVVKLPSQPVQLLLDIDSWHCFHQACHLLSEMVGSPLDSHKVGLIVGWAQDEVLSRNLIDCENHCKCYLIVLLQKAVKRRWFKVEATFLGKLLDDKGFFARCCRRCANTLLVDLMILLIDPESNQSQVHSLIIDWTLNGREKHFNSIVEQFVAFGGPLPPPSSCSEASKHLLNNDCRQDGAESPSEEGITELPKYTCDIVVLRKYTLLHLKALNSASNRMSGQLKKQNLDFIKRAVNNKCRQDFDSEDWLLDLFLDEDCELLSALLSLIGLVKGGPEFEEQMAHNLMASVIKGLHEDAASLFLDWLCSDDQTATLLLEVLINYLKMERIEKLIDREVRKCLLDLETSVSRLMSKHLFPFNATPLLKLLNKLR